MRAKIARWGKALAIRIPKTYAKDLGLECMDLDVSLAEGKIILRPTTQYSLKNLSPRSHPRTVMTRRIGAPQWGGKQSRLIMRIVLTGFPRRRRGCLARSS
jgi:antitoxin component of MazEF toxin-antitoxin module